jgi:hypothetical protein
MTEEKDKDKQREQRKKHLIKLYKQIVAEKKELPIRQDFLEHDISKDVLARAFGGIENMHEYMKQEHGILLDKHFSTIEKLFSPERSAVNSNKKRFIITTAVAGSKAHLGFLSTIDKYCEENNAQAVIMPAESITNSFEKQTAVFDQAFNDPKYLFVSEDTPLNNNISLRNIQVSAKQIKPITGLLRIGKREGSYVFAAPKQFLEYVPSGNSREKNYSIMTPGACTLPSYYSETFVSKRLSYIADHDHTMGAIIVELEDDNLFHFRQIQCDEDGSFIDLGKHYKPKGKTTDVEVNVVMGDIHSANADIPAINVFIDLFSKMKVNRLYLHDIFDGYSISHHIIDIAEKSMRFEKGKSNLERELAETFDLVDRISTEINAKEVNIVKSNHDEFLDRYLKDGRYVFDPENHHASLKIATALFEDTDVLERGFEVVGKEIPSNWNFLQRDSISKIAGIECGSHGDLGLNGAKSSMNSLEKIYGSCVVGHNHTGAIQRDVFRVGTLSNLDMGYNRGPSSWTQTCCLVYENGQRQLINNVNGKCNLL